MSDKTEEFYRLNCKAYAEDTFHVDMHLQHEFFEKHLSDDTKTLLDIGFGSGRDSVYFSSKYEVTSLDAEEGFCQHGREIGLKHVVNMKVQDMDFENEFDAIWACASLLHVPYAQLNDVFCRCYKALRENGVMFCCFKLGDYEGERDGRCYTDMTAKRLEGVLEGTGFYIKEIMYTKDNRPIHSENWLNAILIRK